MASFPLLSHTICQTGLATNVEFKEKKTCYEQISIHLTTLAVQGVTFAISTGDHIPQVMQIALESEYKADSVSLTMILINMTQRFVHVGHGL